MRRGIQLPRGASSLRLSFPPLRTFHFLLPAFLAVLHFLAALSSISSAISGKRRTPRGIDGSEQLVWIVLRLTGRHLPQGNANVQHGGPAPPLTPSPAPVPEAGEPPAKEDKKREAQAKLLAAQARNLQPGPCASTVARSVAIAGSQGESDVTAVHRLPLCCCAGDLAKGTGGHAQGTGRGGEACSSSRRGLSNLRLRKERPQIPPPAAAEGAARATAGGFGPVSRCSTSFFSFISSSTL